MRKLFASILLSLAALAARAQNNPSMRASDASVAANSGVIVSIVSVPAGATVSKGTTMFYDGTQWNVLAYVADGDCVVGASGIPSWGSCGGGGGSFSAITGGTNTTAAMVCGTGCSIATSGSGSNTATAVPVGGVSGLGSGVGTWLATPSGANLASALTTGLPLTAVATEAANTVVANVSGGSAAPTAASLPSCTDTSGNHLNYTNGTGFSCGTSSSGATGTGAAYSVLGNSTTGSTTRADVTASFSSVTEPIQGLVCTSGVGCSWSRLPFDTTVATIINSEFGYYGTAGGAGLAGGQAMFQVTVSGASAGIQAQASNQFTTDTNHPNVVEMTTGTVTSGGWTLSQHGSSNTAGASGWGVKTGMVVDWLYNIPVLSGATNTFRDSIGLFDNIGTSAIVNGVFVTLDSNSDTHWAINSCKASTCQGNTASSLVATTGWHHITAVATSATSVTYYVDGTSIGTTNTTADMPVTFNMTPSIRRVASAGCAAVGTCYSVVNTVFAYEPVSR